MFHNRYLLCVVIYRISTYTVYTFVTLYHSHYFRILCVISFVSLQVGSDLISDNIVISEAALK